jgi:hypothetical protein
MVIRHINRLRSKACPRSRMVPNKKKYHGRPELRTVSHQAELSSILGQRAFVDRQELSLLGV